MQHKIKRLRPNPAHFVGGANDLDNVGSYMVWVHVVFSFFLAPPPTFPCDGQLQLVRNWEQGKEVSLESRVAM